MRVFESVRARAGSLSAVALLGESTTKIAPIASLIDDAVIGFILLLIPNFSAPYNTSLSFAVIRTDDDEGPPAVFGAFGACIPFLPFQ